MNIDNSRFISNKELILICLSTGILGFLIGVGLGAMIP